MHYFVSGCENAKMYIWNIPENGLTETLTEPQSYLMGKYTPQYNNYVPPTKGGGGHIVFGADPVGVRVASFLCLIF